MPETPAKSAVTPLLKLGRYEIAAEIGHGAMGTVYKAHDPLIERTVALKTIRLDLSHQARQVFEERFYREAKSAGRLNHPNIVTIYDVGETDGSAYIAMEYLEGESLDTLLDNNIRLSLDRIAHIALQIANGLAYAHQHGVIHRDVKPANIILMRRGRVVKITDFGIAQIPANTQTKGGALLGSPRYMSPEQVQGKVVDGRSDVFSLGVVLYEMLTGCTLFTGDNLSTILYNIMNYEPAPPSSVNQDVPHAFDHIVMRALSKRPVDRYQTARDMATDLRALRGVTPMVVQPVSPDTADTLLAQTRQTDKAMLRTLLSMASMGIATVTVLAMIALVVSSDANHAPPVIRSTQSVAAVPAPVASPSQSAAEKITSAPADRVQTGKGKHPNRIAIAELDKKIQALKVRRAELRSKYTELHPDVVIATREIKRLEKEKRKLAREKN
ncbi:MAG TPA: protein kinase [Sulfuriferula sp.]|nr:protein kinase [Sulfuriferula sp.]